MKVTRTSVLFVLVLALGGVDVVGRQQRDRPGAAVPTGTAGIAGTVVSEDTPASGIRRARVTLGDFSGAQIQSAFSDDNGRFAFEGLPAGRFVVSAAKGGYVKTTLGAVRPGGAGVPVVVASGQRVGDIALRLVRGAVITGTLRDSRGAPVPDTTIRVQRYGFSGGVRALVDVPDVASAITDDRGVYRLFGLPEGAYVVSAIVGDSALESQTRVTTPERLQRAKQLLASPGMSAADSSTMAAPAVAFASTYYPGTAVVADAGEVRVAAGEERVGIDLPLLFVRTVELSGVIVDAAGAPAAGARVWMFAADGSSLRGQSYRLTSGRDGTFTATRVPPGDYVIGAEGAPPGPGSFSQLTQNVPSSARTLWARLPVTVSGGADQAGLELRLQPGSKVSGRVVFETGGRQPPSAGGIRIRLLETGVAAIYTLPERVTSADGAFLIDGVAAARYRIDVAAPAGWMLHSIRGASADLADTPLEVRGGEDGPSLTVTFTSRTTELAGAVQDANGAPISAHTVVVFSADRAFWTPQSRRIRTVRPAEDGKFTVSNLPAGEYRIAAVRDLDYGQWFDPQFLSSLVGASVPVTIADGQRTVQNVMIK